MSVDDTGRLALLDTDKVPRASSAQTILEILAKLTQRGFRELIVADNSDKLPEFSQQVNVPRPDLRSLVLWYKHQNQCWFCGKPRVLSDPLCICFDYHREGTFVNLKEPEAVKARMVRYGTDIPAYRWACRVCTVLFSKSVSSVLDAMQKFGPSFRPATICPRCKVVVNNDAKKQHQEVKAYQDKIAAKAARYNKPLTANLHTLAGVSGRKPPSDE